jgi:hypothetical protein
VVMMMMIIMMIVLVLVLVPLMMVMMVVLVLVLVLVLVPLMTATPQVAHSENPAQRSPVPVERYLDHCPRFSKRSLFGGLHLSMESPTLPKEASMRLQVAFMKYMVRM